MNILTESKSVEEQEKLIIKASNNEKLKNKTLEILERDLYEDPKHPESKEQDLYDCEYAIDEAAWEKANSRELSFWRLDTIIRDHIIDAIAEASRKLYKNLPSKQYREFAEKWTLSNPSYSYADISDEIFSRYNSKDLQPYLEGIIENIDPDKIEDDSQRLHDLAEFIRIIKGE